MFGNNSIMLKMALSNNLHSLFDTVVLLERTKETKEVIPPRIKSAKVQLGVAYTRVGDATTAYDLSEYKNRFHSIKVIENDSIPLDILIDMFMVEDDILEV